MLKNDIDALPLNVRRDALVAGYLFVCFLALILRMRLLHLVKEAVLNEKYSIEGLVTELEKLRLTVFPDGTRILAEGTRRPRDIFSAISRCAEFLEILRSCIRIVREFPAIRLSNRVPEDITVETSG